MFSSRLLLLCFAFISLALGLVSATPTPDKQSASALAVLTNCKASTDPILAQIDVLVKSKTATTENITPLLTELSVVIQGTVSSLEVVGTVTSEVSAVATVAVSILLAINSTLLSLVGLDLESVISLIGVVVGSLLVTLGAVVPGSLGLVLGLRIRNTGQDVTKGSSLMIDGPDIRSKIIPTTSQIIRVCRTNKIVVRRSPNRSWHDPHSENLMGTSGYTAENDQDLTMNNRMTALDG
ncbi:hypothetical protein EV421DRAFT_1738859 [Armillaria borealis]|uniref:Uncharacterized protein n=1 Tax=Armillaria borealis TaxID=47425 RepID=A0AA39MJX4_9AGAR|nr:hypothetical protein EV421DRAFT_1738859 [Armillaria borealis]